MEIVNEFDVWAPRDRVYPALLDFGRLGACIPGAKIGPLREDGSYPAEIAVRLGPMRLNYRGVVRLDDTDESAHTARVTAEVKELRGQGSARATMSMTVTAQNSGSRVSSLTSVELTGRAAQMGAGIVEDVASRLIAEMAKNLEALLEREAGDPPVPAAGPSAGGGPAGDSGSEPHSPSPSKLAHAEDRSAAGDDSLPGPSPKPIGGFGLLASALWDRLRKRLRLFTQQPS